MKSPPDDVKLSREAGDALIARLQANTVTSDARQLLVKRIQLYFWFRFALSETKISWKRLKRALFGGGKPPSSPPAGDGSSGGTPVDPVAGGGVPPSAAAPVETSAPDRPRRRHGHGRQNAAVYTGAERVVCRHETLAAGQRCPACGRGTLYPLPAGVAIRIDGHALLSAIRYELEKLRCSACGEVFIAPMPASAGVEKYSPQAQAVIALGRYYLGLPFYRIEPYQALWSEGRWLMPPCGTWPSG
jgi:transposase